MTGRDLLIQSLREKCLHDLIAQKYSDEGVLFWTFFRYLDECFVEDTSHQATSLETCYDWSTVVINGKEEVGSVNSCLTESFKIVGDFESDNSILAADRKWAT